MSRTTRLLVDGLLSAAFLLAGTLAAEAAAPGRDMAVAWTAPVILAAALQPPLWRRAGGTGASRAAAFVVAVVVGLGVYAVTVILDLATLLDPPRYVPGYLAVLGNVLAPLAALIASFRFVRKFAGQALPPELLAQGMSPEAMLRSSKFWERERYRVGSSASEGGHLGGRYH